MRTRHADNVHVMYRLNQLRPELSRGREKLYVPDDTATEFTYERRALVSHTSCFGACDVHWLSTTEEVPFVVRS